MPVPTHLPATASRRPWLVTLGLWLLLAGLAGVGLWNLRHEALQAHSRELNLLSLALTDEFDRGLRGAEDGLRALRTELADGRLPLSGPESTPALRTRADLMPLVSTLWLLDSDGRVLAASDAAPAPDLSSFAPAPQALGTDAPAVSRPFTIGAQPDSMVALAMRFQYPRGGTRPVPGGGRPAALATGWVLAAMPASALLGAFNATVPAVDAQMAVVRSDGVRLAGTEARAPALPEGAASTLLPVAQQPRLQRRMSEDGSDSLVGQRSVPRYAVSVVVTRDLSAVLRSWRRTAELTIAAAAVLLLGMAAAVHFVQQANRRRSEAQHALQAQLSRASKLESLGTLAGGVAHDFNNILAGIMGYGEMAQDTAVPGSAQARHIDKVLQAALRGKSLAERILAFSRGGARASTVFELEPVVEEVLGLLSGSLRPGIVLERALQTPGGRLRGDPTQAFQAVMNLCSNAMQAMPGGGMLSVQLAREHVAAPRVLSHSALPLGDYIVLSITDQGTGITPEVMEHLFEPFFTTRAAGPGTQSSTQPGMQSGTGLGLAVVHGVVAEFGGAIDVRSSPGAGAEFKLYLPECTEAVAALPAPVAAASQGRGQRLLVVDDDPDLVSLATGVLHGLGYVAEGCIDPRVALQTLQARPGDFACVITDEVMPQLTGTQLTAAVRAFAPQLPVLLVTGYGGALLAQRAADAGVSRVLAKPLQRADLARALAALLR